jgi:hypothetical protein
VIIQDPKRLTRVQTISLKNYFQPCVEDDHKNKDTFIKMNLDQGQDLFGVVLNEEREMKAKAHVPPPGFVPEPQTEQIGTDLHRSIAVKK